MTLRVGSQRHPLISVPSSVGHLAKFTLCTMAEKIPGNMTQLLGCYQDETQFKKGWYRKDEGQLELAQLQERRCELEKELERAEAMEAVSNTQLDALRNELENVKFMCTRFYATQFWAYVKLELAPCVMNIEPRSATEAFIDVIECSLSWSPYS